MNRSYVVKCLLRNGDVIRFTPPMNIQEATRISRDLQLMMLTAWLEEVKRKENNES